MHDMLLEKSHFTHQIKVCLFELVTSVFQMVLFQYREIQYYEHLSKDTE